MLKKSTLLFVSIFSLLFIGVSDYGFGCHRTDVTHGPDPHPCPDGGGSGNSTDEDVGLYIVTISGDGPVGSVAGETDTPWPGRINETNVDINNGGIPGWTDLSFFQNGGTANVAGGDFCFFTPVEFRGSLWVGKGGTATTKFGFDGYQDDGETEARYSIWMFGTFDDYDLADCYGECGVFPLEVDEFARMELVDWELRVQGGKNISNVSCIGESDPELEPPTLFNPPVVILVERIN